MSTGEKGDRRKENRRTGGQGDRKTGGQEDRRIGGQEDRRIGGQEERRTGGQEDRRQGSRNSKIGWELTKNGFHVRSPGLSKKPYMYSFQTKYPYYSGFYVYFLGF